MPDNEQVTLLLFQLEVLSDVFLQVQKNCIRIDSRRFNSLNFNPG
jgi:hypothetical protein